jgi:hypothetical protein
VLVALFAGIPDRIEIEEPHHGVQFGVTAAGDRVPHAAFAVDPRSSNGVRRPSAAPFPVAVRATDPALRVLELADLRRIASYRRDLDDPALPVQTGSAAFVTQLLRPPWKQVFSDEQGAAGPGATGPSDVHVVLGPPVADLAAEVDVDALRASAGQGAGRS